MTSIAPESAAAHRSAITSDPASPELIAGRQVEGDALFSSCKSWRYRLTRRWTGGTGVALWVMLNPSTADAQRVDPTVRRSVSFSMRWGYSTCWVGNVFALRATKPDHLYTHADPTGPENDFHLSEMAAKADRIVVAWGNHAKVGSRYRSVAGILLPHRDRCVHLGLTASGMPTHPLYRPSNIEPMPAGEVVDRLLLKL